MNRPNILLMMADDMNYNSVGCFGCPVDDITPNFDRLASEGVIFDNAHVTIAVCQPSRECLLTGVYPHRNGAPGFMPIADEIPTLTDLLREEGYYNGIIGKVEHCVPEERFAWDYVCHTINHENMQGRSPEVYGRRAKEFFNKVKEADKPFFLMANSHDPHRPFAGSDDEVNRFFGYHTYASRVYTPEEAWVPGFLPDLPEVRKELAQYYTSVHRCDESIGAVLKALDEAGFADNTLVIYMSDNGMAFPFSKANCYLNSTKTPFIARWPGHIRPGTRNSKDFISGVDFAPTVLEALGLTGRMNCDGMSYLPLLEGGEQPERDNGVYTQFNLTSAFNAFPMRCYQTEKYGYIFNDWSDGVKEYKNESQTGLTYNAMVKAAEGDESVAKRVDMFLHRVPEEFYDFANDPDGLNNLIDAPEYQDIIKEYKAKLHEYMVRYEDPVLEQYNTEAYKARVDSFRSEAMERFRKRRMAMQGAGK